MGNQCPKAIERIGQETMKVKVCLALALISVIILQFCEASSNVPDEDDLNEVSNKRTWDSRIRLAKKSWDDSRIRLAKKWDSRIRLAKKYGMDWDKRIRLAKKSWDDSRIRLAKKSRNDSRIRLAKKFDSRIRLAKKDNVDSDYLEDLEREQPFYTYVMHEEDSY